MASPFPAAGSPWTWSASSSRARRARRPTGGGATGGRAAPAPRRVGWIGCAVPSRPICMDVLEVLEQALSDRYAIEREIGAGGMATVYLARDLRHDRPVALKLLNPELGAEALDAQHRAQL